MAIRIFETPDSRSGSLGETDEAELRYTVIGTSDDADVYNEVTSLSPSTHNDLIRKTVSVEPDKDSIDENNPDKCIWRATVSYGSRNVPVTGEEVFSFDTTGGTALVHQAETHIADYPAGATNHGGAINVEHDGTGFVVNGVDIATPTYSWSEIHYLTFNTVNNAYKGTLFRITGKINDGPFKGFKAGEVLFRGASGSRRGTEDWEISFHFSSSPEKTNFEIGGIVVTQKAGWDLAWVEYQSGVGANSYLALPTAVHIEKLYEDADFWDLGIGII